MRSTNSSSRWRLSAALAVLVGFHKAAAETAESFERILVYSLERANYTLQISPADESGSTATFADDAFAFMVVSTATADMEGLESAEGEAEAAWEEFAEGHVDPTEVAPGDSVVPNYGVVYELDLVTGNPTPPVFVRVLISESGAYALFLQHGSEEFLVTLTDGSDATIDAVAEEEVGAEEATDSPTAAQWSNAILASFVISICSLVGIVLVSSRSISRNVDLSHACLLASGALLAATLLHIIPEALEGLEEEYPDNLHALGLRAGIAILSGIFFGVILHAMLSSGHSHDHSDIKTDHHHVVVTAGGAPMTSVSAPLGETGGSTSRAAVETGNNDLCHIIYAHRTRKLWDLKGLQPVCWNVIIGDLVHNFADGVTVGAAFLNCSSTIGWTVTAAAILHEIPHELADFMALINGGMTVAQAIVFNFLTALSAVLGVVLMLALRGELTTAQVSFLLLLGGGSFIFIALSELVPDAVEVAPNNSTTYVGEKGASGINELVKPPRASWIGQSKKLVSFILGALLIGIPLIWDEHCEAGSGHSH